jgi:hypothetical protein
MGEVAAPVAMFEKFRARTLEHPAPLTRVLGVHRDCLAQSNYDNAS